jgi:hypothetical protein
MFWQKKKQEVDKASVADRAAAGIARMIVKTQMAFARLMGRRTAHFQRRSKVVFLIIVCFAFGGLSLRAIVTAFNADVGDNLRPDEVRVPKYYNKTGEENGGSKRLVNPQTIEKIKSFRRYTDSLRRSPDGRMLYDSMLRTRPGLMDSVALLEELFHAQQKQ